MQFQAPHHEHPSVFSFSSYRSFLRARLVSKETQRGLLSKMCREVGCQNAHLTRVLQEKVHLTLDQVFLTCRFLGLSQTESMYLMKLAEHDRAGNPHYRAQLQKELKELRQEQEDLSKRIQKKRMGDFQSESIYYANWYWVAIHYMTAIREFQTVEKMSRRLNLSESLVRQSLKTLEEFGLVKRTGERWILASGSIHLPKNSPFNSVQHGNWRHRAVLKSQEKESDGIHYTVVQSISHEDFQKLKQIFLDTLDEYRKCADVSPSEELVSVTLDFFRV